MAAFCLPALGASLAAMPRPCYAGGGQSHPTVVALEPSLSFGRGAELTFLEYEAETSMTNGHIVGPDRHFGTLAAEASGRRAVMLKNRGDYVEFALSAPANGITVRYAVPDGPDGTPIDASLGVYVEGRRIGELLTTSRYAWFYGKYPFSNNPADGMGHHFFDHARILLDRPLTAGTVVRLMRGPTDCADWYAIDLVDFENVPGPIAQYPHSLAVTNFGADPSGRIDARTAFAQAIAAASKAGRIVWVPPGRFRLDGHVSVDRVELAGAGPWYSILQGNGVGLYGHEAPDFSKSVKIHDLAIIGEVTERIDEMPLAAIGGALGGGSFIHDLFIQHVKVGAWFDGPFDGLTIRNLRVFDTTADGLNLHRGISHVLVENNLFRNTGDDGIASWAEGIANHDIEIRSNTIVSPILANGVAIYGGHDIQVSNNLVADTLTEGGGLHVGNRFHAVPLAGRIDLRGNLVVRAGSVDPRLNLGIGALWLFALDAPINAQINIESNTLLDSSEEAVLLFGRRIDGLALNGLHVYGAGGHLLEFRAPGSGTASGVSANGVLNPPVLNCREFLLDWNESNNDIDKTTQHGC
jgi:hypothetical protein